MLSLVLLLTGTWTSSTMGQSRFILGEDDRWAAEEDPDPTSPEGQLAEARRALAANDLVRAENLATRWIERHTRHPMLPDAYIVRGDARKARGDEYRALFDYEYVARMYPGTEAFVVALERELEIAKAYARGKKRKLWGMRIINAADEAEELFIRIQERMPGSRIAEEAGWELGNFYFTRGNMALAAEAYDLFIDNYPNSERISDARRRLIYAYLASFKGPEFDISGLFEARFHLQALKVIEPMTAERIGADALLIRIDESSAMKKLENARWYLRTGDVIAAELNIRRLIERYPATVAAAEALDMTPQILARLPERIRAMAPDYEAMREGLARTDADE